MQDDKKNKSNGLTAALWVLFALILLILFLVNRNNIFGALKETGFFTKVFGSEPEFIQNFEVKEDTKKEPIAEVETIESVDSDIEEKEVVSEKVSKKTIPEIVIKEETNEKPSIEKQKEPIKENVIEEKEKPVEIQQMKQYLCFIMINGDGSVIRKDSTRTIPKTQAPLTAAIKALLKGPNFSEMEQGYMSLIPDDTKLLGAIVKNNIATIDFSDEFLINKYGVEGYYGQLMQIVYTATAFSNITSVQFLINGTKYEYLGSEGVYIGSPLSKTSFK